MTALDKYQRLEAFGEWRRDGQEPLEVLVQFGKSSLVLASGDDAPLTHWSLPAIDILSRAEDATTYALDNDHSETLTIVDRDMRAALDVILSSKSGLPDHTTSRSRWVLPGAAILVFIGLAWFFGPGLMANLASRLVAPERAMRLAAEMVPIIETRTAPLCHTMRADAALETLVSRLSEAGITKIDVLDLGDIPALGLPGGHVLVGRRIVEQAASVEEIAGWSIAAAIQAEEAPALAALFGPDGLSEGLTFLASGTLTEDGLATMVDRLLIGASRRAMPPAAAISKGLTDVSVDPSAFQAGLEREGLSRRLLDNPGTSRPILDDQGWVALQEICNN